MSGLFVVRRARTLRRAAAGWLSVLTLTGLMSGGATAAQASGQAAALAGSGCPRSVTGGTARSVTVWPAAGRSGVPWRSVGRGWILADLAASGPDRDPRALYLVSPGGRRYRLGAVPAADVLEDWSGNGANALLLAQGQDSTSASVIVLDLRAGQASTFKVYSGTAYPDISFSRPAGQAILFQGGATPQGGWLPLQRFSLTGTRELCYPVTFPRAGSVNGGFLETANGTELVFSTQNGMEVVSNGGQPIRALATKSGPDTCGMLNFWDSQSVAADCAAQLVAFPLSGGQPDQLTSSRDSGTFVGAWRLPTGTYAEAAACGTTWLERLHRNGTATTLTIPGAADAGTVHPLGTYGDQLPLLIAGGCDGHFPFSFIDWYQPSANVARTVLGGRAGGGYVIGAVLFRAN